MSTFEAIVLFGHLSVGMLFAVAAIFGEVEKFAKRLSLGLPQKPKKTYTISQNVFGYFALLVCSLTVFFGFPAWARWVLEGIGHPSVVLVGIAILPWLVVICLIGLGINLWTADVITENGYLRLRMAAHHRKMRVLSRTETESQGTVLTTWSDEDEKEYVVLLHEDVEELYERAELGKEYVMYWDREMPIGRPIIIGILSLAEAKEVIMAESAEAA